MSDTQPVERIPLRFLYMCMHHLTGYFRRRDGSPLNLSNMTGPNDREVIWERFDPQFDPQVRPQLRPLLRLCRRCKQRREERVQQLIQNYQYDLPVGPLLTAIHEMRLANCMEDVVLMEKALGIDTRKVKERLEARLIVAASSARNNGSTPQEPQELQGLQQLQHPQQPPRRRFAWRAILRYLFQLISLPFVCFRCKK